MVFDFVLISVLFLPGILLLTSLSKKIKTTMNVLEIILFGSILWNYFLVSTSILLGSFTQLIAIYFKIFNIISVAVIIISFIYIVRSRKIKFLTKFRAKLVTIPYAVSFSLLMMIYFLAIYFHTIYIEWDAIYAYIPSAKAILVSGGLSYQPYRLLNFSEISPAVPIVYAWIFEPSNIEYLYALPFVYFLLTVIAIFLISRKLFSHDVALISSLVFMSLPTVIITASSRSLYLDMPFVLYFLATLYSTIRIINAKKSGRNSLWFEYMMFATGLTLMFLTRIEFGLLLAPAAFAALIFAIKPNHWEITLTLTIGLGYYLREIRNILLDPSWSYYLQRLISLLIISALIFIIMKHVSTGQSVKNKSLNKKSFVLTLLLFFPLTVYLLRNIIVSGFIVPSLPTSNNDILNSAKFFSEIKPSTRASLVELLRWDHLVLVWWLIPPYLIPVSISLAVLTFGFIKKRDIRSFNISVLLFFAGIFVLWSTFSCDPQPRKLYYFAPFVSLITAHGLSKIRRFFSPLGFTLRVSTYVIAVTTYALTKMEVKTVNDISLFYAQLYQPKTDMQFIAVSAVLFLLIFVPYEVWVTRTRKKIKASRKISATIVLLTLCLNVILISIPIAPVLSGTVNRGYQSRYEYHGGWFHYPDVVDYYNENITDNYTTIGFYCHELITFADRSVIDLSDPIYGSPIYSILPKANHTEVLNTMKKLDVKYFLLPKPNNPFYSLYEELVNGTCLGSIFRDNPQLYALRSFKYVTLYKLYENYSIYPVYYSKVMPWNYNLEKNITLTLEQNSTKFCGTTTSSGRISLMYVLESPSNISDALWLNIRSYKKAQLIVALFSNLQNRTTDFFAFRCQLTNETRKPIININEGSIKGKFNPNHIEGILIGIETEPYCKETFEISGLYLIAYENI